jgi:hypothetical protein
MGSCNLSLWRSDWDIHERRASVKFEFRTVALEDWYAEAPDRVENAT